MSLLNLAPAAALEHEPALRRPSTSWKAQAVAGAAVILGAFGGFGGWAALASLSSAAIAPGQVTVSSNRQAVQHLEGGIVSELLVRDGDVVKAGDVLIRLDPTQARAQVGIIQGQLDALVALLSRLRAERDGAATIGFPEDLLARASADQALADAIASQQGLFAARQATLGGQISILRNRIVQLQGQKKGAAEQEQANHRQIDLIEDELTGLRSLYEKGYASRTRILALEREAERLRGERGEAQGTVARTEEAIGEARLQILQQEKAFKEDVAKELQDAQVRIADLSERLIAAKDVLERRELRAPRDGIVVGLAAHTVGGVISPGATVLEIVPIDDELVVEAQLQPLDIDNVHVGQPADIRFSSLKSRTTPVLEGRVETVSADALTDQRTGVTYFKTRVTVPRSELEKLHGQPLLPGMPAEVLIKTGDRTALDYMISPLTDIWAKSMREP